MPDPKLLGNFIWEGFVMSRWTQLTGATALACAFTSSAAMADVTGQDVWNDWRTYMTDFGYVVTGDESRSGDTLTITNLSMVWDLPEDEGTFVMSMPEMSFTDQGDGSVAVGMPSTSTLKIDVAPAEGEALNATVALDMTGMSTIVSGDPDDLAYSYTAASLKMALTEFVVDGDAPDELTFEMVINNVIGQSTMKVGDMRDVAQKFSADQVTYELRVVDEAESADVVATGSVDNLSFEGEAVVPSDYDVEDPSALFKAGFGFTGTFSQGGSQMQLKGTADGDAFNVETSAGSGELEMAMDEAGFAYAGGGSDITVNVAGSDIPFPVSFEMAEAGYELLMPLMAADEEQDFAFGLTLGGLAVPDLLWSIFDPTAVLPRDPATLSFDLEGKTRLLMDLMDPTIEDSDEFPGELTALTLSDLVIEIGGAELTGKGDFTFDNTDTQSFDGMPRPLGEANFRLLGGNGLLDKLIQMGIVQEQDAMGARMMMGLFTTPGPAEDELNSTIEVNEDGHVLANGQRIK